MGFAFRSQGTRHPHLRHVFLGYHSPRMSLVDRFIIQTTSDRFAILLHDRLVYWDLQPNVLLSTLPRLWEVY